VVSVKVLAWREEKGGSWRSRVRRGNGTRGESKKSMGKNSYGRENGSQRSQERGRPPKGKMGKKKEKD